MQPALFFQLTSRLWQLVLTCSAPMPKCPQLPKNPIYPALCAIIPTPLPAAQFIASPRSSSKPVSMCHFTPPLSLPGLQGVSRLTVTFLPCHLLRYLCAQAASFLSHHMRRCCLQSHTNRYFPRPLHCFASLERADLNTFPQTMGLLQSIMGSGCSSYSLYVLIALDKDATSVKWKGATSTLNLGSCF